MRKKINSESRKRLAFYKDSNKNKVFIKINLPERDPIKEKYLKFFGGI